MLQVIKKEQIEYARRLECHPLYSVYINLKSATIELARQIAREKGEHTPKDIKRFLEEFGQKT